MVGDLSALSEVSQAFLVTDKRIVTEIDFQDIPLILLAAYFGYNICYPKGCVNFFVFLEVMLLKIKTTKASITVHNLLSSLSAHDHE